MWCTSGLMSLYQRGLENVQRVMTARVSIADEVEQGLHFFLTRGPAWKFKKPCCGGVF
jgi:hypothetical protein